MSGMKVKLQPSAVSCILGDHSFPQVEVFGKSATSARWIFVQQYVNAQKSLEKMFNQAN